MIQLCQLVLNFLFDGIEFLYEHIIPLLCFIEFLIILFELCPLDHLLLLIKTSIKHQILWRTNLLVLNNPKVCGVVGVIGLLAFQ
uniref:Uncharacterized protein n=1 Tax=Arundo donax TaxID=35708 RepID=A0A0A9CNI3_ARUDO